MFEKTVQLSVIFFQKPHGSRRLLCQFKGFDQITRTTPRSAPESIS